MSDNEVEQYESDGEDFNPKAHKKLIAGVGSLQKGQFIKKATRDEPALRRNEFNLVKSNITDAELTSKSGKVDVNDLVSVLDKTNKHLKLGKVLKKTIDKKKILPVPLQKPAAERLQRAINYEKSKEKLERWDATVAKHRSSDHLVIDGNSLIHFSQFFFSLNFNEILIESFPFAVFPTDPRENRH